MASNGNTAKRIYKVTERFRRGEWKKFAKIELKLRPHDIEEIELNHPGDYGEQKYQMVDKWMKREGLQATIDHLERLANKFHSSNGPVTTLSSDVKDVNFNSDNSMQLSTEPPSAMSTVPYNTYSTTLSILQGGQQSETFTPGPLTLGSAPSVPKSNNMASQKPELNQASNEVVIRRNDVAKTFEDNDDKRNQKRKPDLVKRCEPVHDNKEQAAAAAKPPAKIVVEKTPTNKSKSERENQGSTSNDSPSKEGFVERMRKKLSFKKTKNPATPAANLNPVIDYCSKVESINVKPTTSDKYKQQDTRNEYSITKKNKGKVLILNNRFLGQGNWEREGAELDGKNMETLWEKIGCHVYLEEDKTADEMMEEIQDMAKTKKTKYDFIVVVVMSHGGIIGGEIKKFKDENNEMIDVKDENIREYFLGNDCKKVFLDNVMDYFTNENAPSLQGIPKFFIFQFCRGSKDDDGTDVATDGVTQTIDQHLENVMKHYAYGSEIETDANDPNRLPKKSDIIIAYSTHLKYTALRNRVAGSWFINAIVNVFTEFAHEEHVADLLTKVNGAMAIKEGNVIQEINGKEVNKICKAMSHHDSSLTKKFFLFPGYPN